ncbi:MAG: AbrB/MazE/SpoVT family DNA-binding domain-containing protein [Deltaproteobacteria bacterium]|nr:AbrB/MazE/SpoVT family DNA-binding domain-containing protein [Deltaproteobacteria bacterium]
MKTAADNAGRVVIPKALREAAGIRPGAPLEIRVVGDHLEIEAAPLPVRLERRSGLLVAVPEGPRPVLSNETVRKTVDDLRSGRGAVGQGGDAKGEDPS